MKKADFVRWSKKKENKAHQLPGETDAEYQSRVMRMVEELGIYRKPKDGDAGTT